MSEANAHLRTVAALAAAIFSTQKVGANEIPATIKQISDSLRSLATGEVAIAIVPSSGPAVSIKKSIFPNHLVCLDDGLSFKSLKRHLMSAHGLTPDEYRAKWGLPHDYPMVAPNYSSVRSELAKSFGLGSKPETEVIQAAPVAEAEATEVVAEAEAEAVAEIEAEAVEAVAEVVAEAEEAVAEIEAEAVLEVETIVEAAAEAEAEVHEAAETLAEVIENFEDGDSKPIGVSLDHPSVTAAFGTLPEGYLTANDTFVETGIVCLIDGKTVKDLGRHARKHHGASADDYRARFGLPANYPMNFEGIEKFKSEG